jgi:hypothetical protein
MGFFGNSKKLTNVVPCYYDNCVYDPYLFSRDLDDMRRCASEDYAIYYGADEYDKVVFRVWDSGLVDVFASMGVTELRAPDASSGVQNIFQICNRDYLGEIFPTDGEGGPVNLYCVNVSSQFKDAIDMAAFAGMNIQAIYFPFNDEPFYDFNGSTYMNDVCTAQGWIVREESMPEQNDQMDPYDQSAYYGQEDQYQESYASPSNRSEPRVFIGGTCGGSTWRNSLISTLENYGIDYFNPATDDCTEESYQQEAYERSHDMVVVYVLSNDMEGIYTIGEIIDDCHECPNNLIVCNLWQDNRKQQFMNQNIARFQQMVEDHNVQTCTSIQDLADMIYYKMQDLYKE